MNKTAHPREASQGRRLRTTRIATSFVALAILLGACFVVADYWQTLPANAAATFVGRAACIDCHRKQAAAFAGSHHDKAMALATDESVLGDFNDATIEHDGIVSRMYRDGPRFMIHTEGETGEMEDFEVKYVFGVEPLQQYMVEFDRDDSMTADEIPRVQVLRISWNTLKKEWFYLRPPDVREKLEPDDPLHWTGIAQRWQTMCADCHSTNLQANFDTQTASYHTTFSEINVSCEACHGPGSLHVELAQNKTFFWDRHHGYGLAALKGEDPQPQLHACAPCHSRRGVLDAPYVPGQKYHDFFQLELLQNDTYYADGQIKDEVYEFGSFTQSKMYHKGIRCSDCHDPHSLQLKQQGNATCTSCHQHPAGKYDVPSHHHHAVGSEAAQCVNCHMPGRTYMDVDFRRDHSLRIPRPDLSVQWGTPNACSSCHVADVLDQVPEQQRETLGEYAHWLAAAEAGDKQIAELIKQTDQWCAQAAKQWYGDKQDAPMHYGEAIAAFRAGDREGVKMMLALALQRDELTPAIARATALDNLAAHGETAAAKVGTKLLTDGSEHPLVRAAAVRTLAAESPTRAQNVLLPLLTDESRLVRNEVAQLLATPGLYHSLSGAEQTKVDLALREVEATLMLTADRAGAHLAWATICEQRGKLPEAIAAYETAMRVEPKMAGPRTNLAALWDQIAERGDDRARQRAEQLRKSELPLLARDAKLAPENATVQYRYGLALYLSGDYQQALTQLEKAAELAPQIEDYQLAPRLLREKLEAEKPQAKHQ